MKQQSYSRPVTAGCALLAAALLAVMALLVSDGQVLREASAALHIGEALPEFTWGIKPYGLCLAVSALAAWGVAMLLCRKSVPLGAGVVWFALALGCGLVLSRAVFCLAESSYYNPAWIQRGAVLRLMDGGMAMTGALLGVLLAAVWVKPCRRMAAVAAPLFIVGARLGEKGYSQVLGTGLSVEFRNFFTRSTRFSARLDVSMLEAACALVIFAVMAWFVLKREKQKTRRDGWALALFFLLYGASQVLMESLRKDQHLIWSFTKAQQITAILMALAALLYAAAVKRQYVRAFLYTLCAAGPLVALEFALDKSTVDKLLLYAVYLLILGVYLFLALRLFRSNRAEDAVP